MPKAVVPRRPRRAQKVSTAAAASTASMDTDDGDLQLSHTIIQKMREVSDIKTQQWFTNYVKGTTWIGCKVPVTRKAVTDVMKSTPRSFPRSADAMSVLSTGKLVENAVYMLQQKECDVKLAGMMLLSEHVPVTELATESLLTILETKVLAANHVADWSSADWFAMRVLKKITLAGKDNLTLRILGYAENGTNIWYRRCGLVSFIGYEKKRSELPPDIGQRLVTAVEKCLLASPDERFCQTGCAWLARYILTQKDEKEECLKMILRNGSLWTREAKKSLVEKLGKSDSIRNLILGL